MKLRILLLKKTTLKKLNKEKNNMKITNGHNVKVHYKGTLMDGSEFDNSHNRGKTLDFIVGSNQLLDAFDTAVIGMTKGQTKTFTIPAGDAYGFHDPEQVATVPREAFPNEFEFAVGQQVQGQSSDGRPVVAKILAFEDETVTLDVNHPLAGEDLNFEIEVVDVENSDTTTTEDTEDED
jgi:peptidylprolyl isomerase